MATNIFNYNGTLATTIADASIDTTTSIAMPGRGYINYGESVNQDMLWIMQNFASSSAPINPTIGQLWYNSSTQVLYLFSGTGGWISAGGAVVSAINPGAGSQAGSFWYDTTNKQLNVWSGTAWQLVGPLGSSINTDPVAPAIPIFSAMQAVQLIDTLAVKHSAWEIIVKGVLLAIISADTAYTPAPAIAGFTTINPGLNFNTTVSGAGVTSPNNFTSMQSNLPNTDNAWNMGSASYRFASMYAVNFVGQASSALYADVAERYAADAVLDTGTVVCLGGTAEITSAITLGSEDVFGVISTNPAYLLNSGAGDDRSHPAVALVGRVPCKVIGQVKKGQRLMSSAIAGCACEYDGSRYGMLSIIGRSLVDKTSAGIELIEIVIGKN